MLLNLTNPTIQQLESYRISATEASQLLQGLSDSLDLTISATTTSSGSLGYSINAIPTLGSAQLCFEILTIGSKQGINCSG